MQQFASAAEPQNAGIGTEQYLADIDAAIDAAISSAEHEFAVGGVLLDAREVLPVLREKHFG